MNLQSLHNYYYFFIMIILINANQQPKPTVLNIGELFNSDNDQQDLQVAQIAIEEINLRSKDLFNGRYILSLVANDSRV